MEGVNNLAGQGGFQSGCWLKGIVTRDLPISLEKPEKLRTWVQCRGGLWESEYPGIGSKSEHSVVKAPRPILDLMQPGGREDMGAVMGFNTAGWQREEPGRHYTAAQES